MRRVLTDTQIAEVTARAAADERDARRTWPGHATGWQPRSTAYVPADSFDAGTAAEWGQQARELLERHAADGRLLAERTGVHVADPEALHARVVSTLDTAAVEDVRVDFEDGYGVRDDAEEDRDATAAGEAVAAAAAAATLPRRYGLRPKSFADGHAGRSVRTLDLFLCAVLDHHDGTLPPGLRITYPKVVSTAHVAGFARVLEDLESGIGLHPGVLSFEVQVETPMSIVNEAGANALRSIVAAGDGRVTAAHLGVFDYTAALALPPDQQRIDHPACDAARDAMQTALARTGVELSDGATNVTPRTDSGEELARVWRTHVAGVRHGLRRGFVQGWDMHPTHLVSRVAAVVEHYSAGLDEVCERVRAWRSSTAGATGVTDEPATVATLLRHLRRAVTAGAVAASDVTARTGLATHELQGTPRSTW